MNTPDNITAIPRVFTDAPEPAVHQVAPAPAAPPSGLADPAAEAARQAAFDSAFAWHGTELHPYSSSRDALFHQLRTSMGAPDFQRTLDDLDAFFGDACRILWLCSHLPEDWSILRCSPAALQCAIDAWADEHIPNPEAPSASLLALRIYTASLKNQHQSAPLDRKPHGDDLGN